MKKVSNHAVVRMRRTYKLQKASDTFPFKLLRTEAAVTMETELTIEAEIERLPVDLLAHIFSFILSFKDLAHVSGVCRKWRRGVKESLSRKERLSFAGWKVDDESAARVVRTAYNIKELDISRSCWGCQITDEGLYKISLTKCVGNLLSISMWGMAGITDRGVIQLVLLYYAYCNMALAKSVNGSKVTKANSLQHLNVGGTFITDESLYAVANSCPQIKTIVLWSCRHVTENGLNKLVDKCRKLESINVWGMRVPVDCFLSLLAISPTLELKPLTQHLGAGRIWPAS